MKLDIMADGPAHHYIRETKTSLIGEPGAAGQQLALEGGHAIHGTPGGSRDMASNRKWNSAAGAGVVARELRHEFRARRRANDRIGDHGDLEERDAALDRRGLWVTTLSSVLVTHSCEIAIIR